MTRPTPNIILSEYDSDWPRLFEEERTRLQEAIGQWAFAIEHVGSTAIPGIAAKPIIDIGVALRRFEDALHCITPLVEAGWVCMGEFGIPGRIFFRKTTDNPLPGQAPSGSVGRTHQIHMYELTHEQYAGHIVFRDYLRTHPEAAREYEALKVELSQRHAGDVEAYSEERLRPPHLVVGRTRRQRRPRTGDHRRLRSGLACYVRGRTAAHRRGDWAVA